MLFAMGKLKGANCRKVSLRVDGGGACACHRLTHRYRTVIRIEGIGHGTRRIVQDVLQDDVRLHLLHVCVWCGVCHSVIAHWRLARKVAHDVDERSKVTVLAPRVRIYYLLSQQERVPRAKVALCVDGSGECACRRFTRSDSIPVAIEDIGHGMRRIRVQGDVRLHLLFPCVNAGEDQRLRRLILTCSMAHARVLRRKTLRLVLLAAHIIPHLTCRTILPPCLLSCRPYAQSLASAKDFCCCGCGV